MIPSRPTAFAAVAAAAALSMTGCLNAHQPDLQAPSEVHAGDTARFSDRWGDDNDLSIRYRWDLDGDGYFETDTGFSPRAARRYDKPGTVNVSVDSASDNLGLWLHGY